MKFLDIKTPIVKASDYNFVGQKSNLVLDMCLNLNANTYIFGEMGKKYANPDLFNSNGISLYFQNYKHPMYTQINGNFLLNMSVIDLLFNEEPNSYDILMSGNKSKIN